MCTKWQSIFAHCGGAIVLFVVEHCAHSGGAYAHISAAKWIPANNTRGKMWWSSMLICGGATWLIYKKFFVFCGGAKAHKFVSAVVERLKPTWGWPE